MGDGEGGAGKGPGRAIDARPVRLTPDAYPPIFISEDSGGGEDVPKAGGKRVVSVAVNLSRAEADMWDAVRAARAWGQEPEGKATMLVSLLRAEAGRQRDRPDLPSRALDALAAAVRAVDAEPALDPTKGRRPVLRLPAGAEALAPDPQARRGRPAVAMDALAPGSEFEHRHLQWAGGTPRTCRVLAVDGDAVVWAAVKKDGGVAAPHRDRREDFPFAVARWVAGDVPAQEAPGCTADLFRNSLQPPTR